MFVYSVSLKGSPEEGSELLDSPLDISLSASLGNSFFDVTIHTTANAYAPESHFFLMDAYSQLYVGVRSPADQPVMETLIDVGTVQACH